MARAFSPFARIMRHFVEEPRVLITAVGLIDTRRYRPHANVRLLTLHVFERTIHYKGDGNPRDDEVDEKQSKKHDQAHGHRHLRLDQVADSNRKQASDCDEAEIEKGSHCALPNAAALER